MRGWHLIIAIVIAFAIGAMYPQPVNFVKSKLGM